MTAFAKGDVVQCIKPRRAVFGERAVYLGHYYRVWDVLPDGSLCLDAVNSPGFAPEAFIPLNQEDTQ